MRKKLILVLLAAVALVGLYFAFRALIPVKDIQLSVPDEIHIDGYMLYWSDVNNSIGYEVEIDGEIRTAATNEIPLRYADNRKQVRVRALGDGERTLSSEFSDYVTLYFRENIDSTESFVYFKTGLLGLDYKEFIYDNTPVRVPTPDYSAYGYEFLYWYRTIDGDTVVQSTDFYSEDSVTLTARIQPIEYKVEFVIEDFPLPQTLPTVFTVRTFDSLKMLTAEMEGYRISDWYVGNEGGELLSSFEVYLGDLTLYPRISLINEGLTFVECDGGYALSNATGACETLHIPKVYNGKPVVKVLKNALEHSAEVGDSLNFRRAVFYGDILLEEEAFGVSPGLYECVFYGNATLPRHTFTLAVEGESRVLNIIIYGTPTVSDELIATLMGMGTDVSVVISVPEEYLAGLEGLSSDVVTVKAI